MALLYIIKINSPRFFIILLTACCILLPVPSDAAVQWSLSAVTGYYLPRLKELNYVLNNNKVELGPFNADAKPAPYPVIYEGFNPGMPDMRPMAPKFGLQLQADISPRYAIVFGNSEGVLDSTKRDVRSFFVGFPIPSNRETRFALSLNQFWLGVKRYWLWGEKTGEKSTAPRRFYTEVGVLAVTKAYLTTDVFLHVYSPEEGFDFYKVAETESKGNGYATYLGVGGEYYIMKWLSVGLDIDYVAGGVSKIKFVRYFTVDPLEKDIIKPGDKVNYTDFSRGLILPLFIDLEGLDFKGQLRFYF